MSKVDILEGKILRLIIENGYSISSDVLIKNFWDNIEEMYDTIEGLKDKEIIKQKIIPHPFEPEVLYSIDLGRLEALIKEEKLTIAEFFVLNIEAMQEILKKSKDERIKTESYINERVEKLFNENKETRDEITSLRSRIELMGIFIAIFSIIIININTLSTVIIVEEIYHRIGMMLIVNGALGLTIVFLIYCIKIILNKEITTLNIWLIFMPIILITIGILVPAIL